MKGGKQFLYKGLNYQKVNMGSDSGLSISVGVKKTFLLCGSKLEPICTSVFIHTGNSLHSTIEPV